MYIYIYIYIYIYNIFHGLYIYIFNPWKIFCNPGFHEVFCKTTITRQLRRWNELKIENTTKYSQKTVRSSFVCGCKCVSVCGCVHMRVCVIVTYGCVFL